MPTESKNKRGALEDTGAEGINTSSLIWLPQRHTRLRELDQSRVQVRVGRIAHFSAVMAFQQTGKTSTMYTNRCVLSFFFFTYGPVLRKEDPAHTHLQNRWLTSKWTPQIKSNPICMAFRPQEAFTHIYTFPNCSTMTAFKRICTSSPENSENTLAAVCLQHISWLPSPKNLCDANFQCNHIRISANPGHAGMQQDKPNFAPIFLFLFLFFHFTRCMQVLPRHAKPHGCA